MRHALVLRTSTFLCLLRIAGDLSAHGEQGKVVVQMENLHHSPVFGAEVGVDGIGTSALTNGQGKALLSIAAGEVGDGSQSASSILRPRNTW
jgi:hypothetical protein